MLPGLRFEGVTLIVSDVARSLEFYRDYLKVQATHVALPSFALIKVGEVSLGLLSIEEAGKSGARHADAEQRHAIHIEFSTDDLDGLYTTLCAKGMTFIEPPHDEPWERSMTALDPDGYPLEFAQGRRSANLTSHQK